MQNDIIRPPQGAPAQAAAPIMDVVAAPATQDESVSQPITESNPEPTEVTDEMFEQPIAALDGSINHAPSAPVGIIVMAVVVCALFVAAAVLMQMSSKS